MIKLNEFEGLSNTELQSTDGGIIIAGVTVSGALLLKLGVTVGLAGITTGVTIGLNRKNRQ